MSWSSACRSVCLSVSSESHSPLLSLYLCHVSSLSLSLELFSLSPLKILGHLLSPPPLFPCVGLPPPSPRVAYCPCSCFQFPLAPPLILENNCFKTCESFRQNTLTMSNRFYVIFYLISFHIDRLRWLIFIFLNRLAETFLPTLHLFGNVGEMRGTQNLFLGWMTWMTWKTEYVHGTTDLMNRRKKVHQIGWK